MSSSGDRLTPLELTLGLGLLAITGVLGYAVRQLDRVERRRLERRYRRDLEDRLGGTIRGRYSSDYI